MKKVTLHSSFENFENVALNKKARAMINGGQLIVFEDYDGDGPDDTPEDAP